MRRAALILAALALTACEEGAATSQPAAKLAERTITVEDAPYRVQLRRVVLEQGAGVQRMCHNVAVAGAATPLPGTDAGRAQAQKVAEGYCQGLGFSLSAPGGRRTPAFDAAKGEWLFPGWCLPALLLQ